MNILQTKNFARQKKKLSSQQIRILDTAVEHIAANPISGEQKKGDLDRVRVHKFRMLDLLCLLAYEYRPKSNEIILLAVGPHENFYRDLKRGML